ncbi:MAG: formylglycine-generating enzyme family protein, partial [Kiritimatiellaeota bacterium]|nr:formylglycine-generating enzyme family protein [Kiritimatiellota bacterium]
FAALIIAGRATAADTPLPITNITVNAGSVTLKWAPPLGRVDTDLHIEAADTLAGPWAEVTPLTKNIGDAIVNVGSNPMKFFRLYAADPGMSIDPSYYPYVPDPEITWTDRVGHTIVINLTNEHYTVTRLPADFCVTNDLASKTHHLYLRYILPTPSDTNDWMGSLVAEASPVNKTNLTLSGYYIGVYAVTEAQYRHVMDGYDPPGLANPTGDDRPVAMITYNDIRKQDDPGTAPSSGGFLWALSNKVDTLGGVSLAFDLPTEAQWEVACRAGTVGTFNNTDLPLASYTGFDASWTNRINEVAWWIGNLAEGDAAYGSYVARPVGLKRANRAGLYDMHGNVVEWCLDSYPTSLYYDAYPAVGGGDQPVLGGSTRSQRGGYWSSITASFIRSAERGSTSAYTLSWYIGFRVCARGEEVSEP